MIVVNDQMSVLVQEILALSKLQEETLNKEEIALDKSSSRVESNSSYYKKKGLVLEESIKPFTIEGVHRLSKRME